MNKWLNRSCGAVAALACWLFFLGHTQTRQPLLNPDAPAMNARAPELFNVRMETSQGVIVLEIHRDWAPHGVDRFYNLVRTGYYDQVRFHRIRKDNWAQFGINGDPKISNVWRSRTLPDDPLIESNRRGTIAYAFAVPNGRTTQVFINLRDNSATYDKEPFVPFGKIVEGLDVADALNAEYGEAAGGGIRAGKQAPLFEGGNAWLALKGNMPLVAVHDLIVHPREGDLVVGTYGRGIWVTDITPLREMQTALQSAEAYFFAIEPKARRREGALGNYRLYGDRLAVTPNEPNGLTFMYYLKEAAKEKVTLTITDASGKTIRTVDGATKAGLNRVVLPLSDFGQQFGGGGFRASGGTAIPPGEYTVTLQTGGKQWTQKARVLAAPLN